METLAAMNRRRRSCCSYTLPLIAEVEQFEGLVRQRCSPRLVLRLSSVHCTGMLLTRAPSWLCGIGGSTPLPHVRRLRRWSCQSPCPQNR